MTIHKKAKGKKILNGTITPLFPAAVYSAHLNRSFTQKELNFVQKNKTDYVANAGNITSKNTYLLNCTPFATLKKELQEYIDEYFSLVISPFKSVTPYITQSWLNYTEPNQFHHTHNHPNSYLSGILIFSADKNVDIIQFHHQRYDQIEIPTKNYNIYNSDRWRFPAEIGFLTIFPSRLIHSVPPTKGTETRISLSFNVFVKGLAGDPLSLTELKL